jgi:hypothetical protein
MSIADQFRIPLRPAKWLEDVENILIAKFHGVQVDLCESESPHCWAFELRENGKLYLTGFFNGGYISEEVYRFWVENHTSPFMIATSRRFYRATREHSFTTYNDLMRILTADSEGAILSTRDVANVVLP